MASLLNRDSGPIDCGLDSAERSSRAPFGNQELATRIQAGTAVEQPVPLHAHGPIAAAAGPVAVFEPAHAGHGHSSAGPLPRLSSGTGRSSSCCSEGGCSSASSDAGRHSSGGGAGAGLEAGAGDALIPHLQTVCSMVRALREREEQKQGERAHRAGLAASPASSSCLAPPLPHPGCHSGPRRAGSSWAPPGATPSVGGRGAEQLAMLTLAPGSACAPSPAPSSAPRAPLALLHALEQVAAPPAHLGTPPGLGMGGGPAGASGAGPATWDAGAPSTAAAAPAVLGAGAQVQRGVQLGASPGDALPVPARRGEQRPRAACAPAPAQGVTGIVGAACGRMEVAVQTDEVGEGRQGNGLACAAAADATAGGCRSWGAGPVGVGGADGSAAGPGSDGGANGSGNGCGSEEVRALVRQLEEERARAESLEARLQEAERTAGEYAEQVAALQSLLADEVLAQQQQQQTAQQHSHGHGHAALGAGPGAGSGGRLASPLIPSSPHAAAGPASAALAMLASPAAAAECGGSPVVSAMSAGWVRSGGATPLAALRPYQPRHLFASAAATPLGPASPALPVPHDLYGVAAPSVPWSPVACAATAPPPLPLSTSLPLPECPATLGLCGAERLREWGREARLGQAVWAARRAELEAALAAQRAEAREEMNMLELKRRREVRQLRAQLATAADCEAALRARVAALQRDVADCDRLIRWMAQGRGAGAARWCGANAGGSTRAERRGEAGGAGGRVCAAAGGGAH